MFDFSIAAGDKQRMYEDLAAAAHALVDGEVDPTANQSNLSALIWQHVPGLNWAGFYRFDGTELVLGPFQGKPACIRIPLGKGVCGVAAAEGRTVCVEDVSAFPGHIACDAASRSEIVVPLHFGGRLVGVLDLDSPHLGHFDQQDAAGLERMLTLVAGSLAGG